MGALVCALRLKVLAEEDELGVGRVVVENEQEFPAENRYYRCGRITDCCSQEVAGARNIPSCGHSRISLTFPVEQSCVRNMRSSYSGANMSCSAQMSPFPSCRIDFEFSSPSQLPRHFRKSSSNTIMSTGLTFSTRSARARKSLLAARLHLDATSFSRRPLRCRLRFLKSKSTFNKLSRMLLDYEHANWFDFPPRFARVRKGLRAARLRSEPTKFPRR